MARPKNPRNTLLHAIEQSSQPIYLLDSENTLVYLNPAAAAWLAGDAEELSGLRCLASAVPLEDRSLDRLRGLIPYSWPLELDEAGTDDPQAAAGLAKVFAVQADGSCSIRRAMVAPIATGESSESTPLASGAFLLVQLLPREASPAKPVDSAAPALADELHQLIVELSALQPTLRELPGLVGKHPLTWRLRKQLEAACETRANLLLIGDEQTLTDSFAKAVANASGERSASLATMLNGRLTDEEQLRETLGGVSRRLSIEKAANATLLILRADLIPATVQPLLRQWLQQQGSQVRTVATSQQSLIGLATAAGFDLELAVRLSTQEVGLPRLAERRSDIPAIATHLLDLYQATRAAPAIRLSAAAIDQLQEFEWTGDLEQLRSVLTQAAAQLPAGGQLLPEHLPEVIRFGIQARRIGRPPQLAINLDSYLEEIERLMLERALQQANQNKAQAARLLGLTRQRFLRRCEHLQLALPEEPIDFRPTSEESDAIDFESPGSGEEGN
ncbi:MAG: helix-turn-helix domain-containing protein [Planctomycetota bacterium]